MGRSLAIDPFSSDKALIIHYLLTKNDIIKLAGIKDIADNSNNTMKFMLTPMKSELGKSSTDLNTDTGGIHAALLWSPNPPAAGSEATLALSFNDALSDSSLKADINYEISVIDSTNGKEIIKKDNLIAINGTGTQKIIFPDSGTYQIEINVKSLKYAGQTTADSARNGIARGFVVLQK